MPDLDYRQKALSAGLIVLFFVGWELFCVVTHMSDLVLPRPSQVFVTLFQKFPILWPHILQTLATTMIGFVLGVGLPKPPMIPAIRCWSDSLRSRRSPWCRFSCCGSVPARCRRY
jgi:ABC-type nitrate/sulfonate/bicarbonate transport system permease component